VERHFAIGDCVSWSGISRAGSALIMGQYAATNIMKMIKSEQDSKRGMQSPAADNLVKCPAFQPMMVLTIGNGAIMYTPEAGVSFGKAVKDVFVGRGYGIDSMYLLGVLPLR
jgi:NADH dehydrogenase FAD-containing subunit